MMFEIKPEDFTGKLIYITPKIGQIFDVNKFLEGCDYE